MFVQLRARHPPGAHPPDILHRDTVTLLAYSTRMPTFHPIVRHACAPTLTLILAASLAHAQPPRVFTAADYARAERVLAPTTNPLVFGANIRPTWLPDDRFWYRVLTPRGA